jgi:hypothetical protein
MASSSIVVRPGEPGRDARGGAARGKNIVVLGTPHHEGRIVGRAFELLEVTPTYVLDGLPRALDALPTADVMVVSREWSRGIRVAVARARRRGIPVVYVIDGVIEWSYVWNNQSFVRSEGTVLQPLLASHLCAIGRNQARILAGLGLADRLHVVGIPRLDDLDRRRVSDPAKPPTVLVTTARTWGHNVEQKTAVRRALRDLKAWFDAHPFIRPVWRVAPEIGAELNLPLDAAGSLMDTLRYAHVLISFTSTTLIEGMAMGVPTVQVDYRAVPQYVQTAWDIRAPEHLDGVLQSALHPAPERLAYQDWCLAGELEEGNASARLAEVICTAVAEGRSPRVSPPSEVHAHGRLDFRQVHSHLSSFAVSPMSVLQYELDATASLLDFAMPEIVRLRAEVAGANTRIQGLESQLQASRAEAEAVRTQLELRTADQARAIEAARADLNARTADHARALQAARAELATRSVEHACAMEAARAELAERTAEHARAKDDARGELNALAADHIRAMEALTAELSARTADFARDSTELEHARQSAEAARRQFMARVYVDRLQPVLRAIRSAKVRQLTVYGAGDVGRLVVAACRASGITVVRVVDANCALWGQAIDGVPVMPLDACVADRVRVVVLASFVHSTAMRKSLRAVLGSKKARIFAPARWVI